MTNQEVNQLYWGIPAHYRVALDLLLANIQPMAAAALLMDAADHRLGRVVTDQEARDWVTWRMSLRQMAGR